MSGHVLPIEDLLKSLAIASKNPSLYEEALTHSSHNAITGTKHFDYERLEFLGDSFVGYVVSDLCYRHHPSMQPGELSRLKSQFIRTESEALAAKKLGLDRYIRAGASLLGEASSSLRILEDVFEAFVGAVYLDQGASYAYDFVCALFEPGIKEGGEKPGSNPKSELQEAIQAEWKEAVSYRLLEDNGPLAEKRFVVGVYFEELELGRGEGHSKKEAETEAALDALRKRVYPAFKVEEKGK